MPSSNGSSAHAQNGVSSSNADGWSSHLGKTKAHEGRRSTPESEALASSDEEHEHSQAMVASTHSASSTGAATKPLGRRDSWLSDIQSQPTAARRLSFGGSAIGGPLSSQPTTPSGENGPLSSTAASRSTTQPWSPKLWNRDAPSRLAEMTAQSSTAFTHDGPLVSPGVESARTTSSPLDIAPGPPFKARRSQSYSVGQLENESQASSTSVSSMGVPKSRVLPRKISQHSLVGGLNRDGSGLSFVPEDEDDVESSNGSDAGVRLGGISPRFEQSSDFGSNTLLRQATVESARARQRASATSASSASSRYRQKVPAGRGPILSTSGSAIDEDHEASDFNDTALRIRPIGRRYSEFQPTTMQDESEDFVDGMGMESLRRAQWHSASGYFGDMGEGQQSRRHSFANLPPRSNTFSSATSNVAPPDEGYGGLGAGLYRTATSRASQGSRTSQAELAPGEEREYTQLHDSKILTGQDAEDKLAHNKAFAASYFLGFASTARLLQEPPQSVSSAPGASIQGAFNGSHAAPNVPKELYVVAFKCSRADIYYVPEGTGLNINQGDMVIVEGDRGNDLGYVTHARVSLREAKELKAAACKEHVAWLMLYSRHTQTQESGTFHPNGMMAASNGERPSALGGMGPRPPLSNPPVQTDENVKPKLIRRLASRHEIQSLQEKEGSEAKAKRICQSKVSEHGLNMEILDAEFQSDYHKLTFYYFAETYINFNDLVTDLFKLYKCRVWMSAINPASFSGSSNALTRPVTSFTPGAAAMSGPTSSLYGIDPAGSYFRMANSMGQELMLPHTVPHYGYDSNGTSPEPGRYRNANQKSGEGYPYQYPTNPTTHGPANAGWGPPMDPSTRMYPYSYQMHPYSSQQWYPPDAYPRGSMAYDTAYGDNTAPLIPQNRLQDDGTGQKNDWETSFRQLSLNPRA